MMNLSVPRLITAVGLLTFIALLAYVFKTQPVWPVDEVAVSGDLSDQQKRAVYRLYLEHDLGNKSLAITRATIEDQSWIRAAAVSRRWPAVMVIAIEPESAIALWNDNAYLNEQGLVFHSEFVDAEGLPQLYGPGGQQQNVMAQYLQLNNMLEVGQKIQQLTLDSRGNWRFINQLEVEVLLGKTELLERVQRLRHITEFIATSGGTRRIKQIDTRYVNGAAVAWQDDSVATQSSSLDAELATNYNSQRELKL